MGLTSQPTVTFQIVLAEDKEGKKTTRTLPVRYCGDVIRGDLEAVANEDFYFEATVAFEGNVRTWLGAENGGNPQTCPVAAECQFLRQTQRIQKEVGARHRRGNSYIYRLPFQFVIPHELISAHADVDPQFLKLCPSTNLGKPHPEPTRACNFRQPLIQYVIKIARIRTDIEVDPHLGRCDQRKITILPYTPAAPPLGLEDFPREYNSCATKTLKQHAWSQPLGYVQISAAEPCPVNLLTPAPRASTVLSVKMRFTPRNSSKMGSRTPCDWPCLVRYCLRSRTFFSTRKLDRIPTLPSSKVDEFIGMHEKKMKWEARECGSICWTRERITGPEELGNEARLDDAWIATIDVPVNVSKMLLTTFLNVLSARRYAIVLHMAIGSLHHGIMELVVPVQLIYSPPEGILQVLEDSYSPDDENVISCTWDREDPLPPYDIG